MASVNNQPTAPRSWIRRHRGWVITGAVAVVLVIAVVATPLTWHRLRYGAEFPVSASSARVQVGDRFSLTVNDLGGSVGDSWSVKEQSDPAVARLIHDELVLPFYERIGPRASGCCSGTHYFTFGARQPGTTTITLYDCFQGCGNQRTLRSSTTRSWTVVVTR
jgi:Chagasin family peptidase inhibitor I42